MENSKFVYLLSVIITVFVFATIYFILGKKNFNGIADNNNFTDYIYFSFITTSSIGYGDITPKTKIAKFFVVLQAITTLTHIIILF